MIKTIGRFLFIRAIVILLFTFLVLASREYSFSEIVVGLLNYVYYLPLPLFIVLKMHSLNKRNLFRKQPDGTVVFSEEPLENTVRTHDSKETSKIQFRFLYIISIISALLVVFTNLSLSTAATIILGVDITILVLGLFGVTMAVSSSERKMQDKQR